ncbi:MAG: hypothetical protein AAFP89_13980 [Bacteroidota bacterium]
MNKANYLRPVFTQRIVKRLKAGEILNLVGKDHQGASRLLEDIQNEQPEGVAVILVDMEVYKDSYTDLLRAMADIMGTGLQINSLTEWFDAIKLHGGQLFLLMNHFDAILNNEIYPATFFEELNEMLLIPNIGFMCVTTRPIDLKVTDLDAFVNRGQFEPEVLKLPPMGYKRMQEELLRFRPDLGNWHVWAGSVYAHPQRYPFLQFVGERLSHLPEDELGHAAEWLARWRAEFDGVEYVETNTRPNFWTRLKNIFS